MRPGLKQPKYLGLPILFDKSQKAAFQETIEEVRNKIEGWKAKTLSQAGISVLIKFVAATPSMP
jgi:hypothetical protein